MARNLTSGLLTELTGKVFRPARFVEIGVKTGFLRVWTGIGNKTIFGNTFTGVGDLLGISDIVEGIELNARGAVVTLSGIPQPAINKVLDETRQGKAFNIWTAALDDVGAIVVDPFLSFEGFTDTSFIDEGANTATVGWAGEGILIALNRPIERRMTPEDQAIDFVGDKGFDMVDAIQEWNGVWGFGAPLPGVPTSSPRVPPFPNFDSGGIPFTNEIGSIIFR